MKKPGNETVSLSEARQNFPVAVGKRRSMSVHFTTVEAACLQFLKLEIYDAMENFIIYQWLLC